MNLKKEIHLKPHNIVFSLLLFFCTISCFYFKEFFKSIEDCLTILGSIASVLGLWFAVDQIIKTKETAESTLTEVKSKIFQVNKAFALSDVSAITKFPSEINENLTHKEYERAYDKMERLQEELIELSSNPRCNEDNEKINEFVGGLTMRMQSVKESINSRNEPCNIEEIDALLNEIRIFLVTKSSKMKYTESSEGV